MLTELCTEDTERYPAQLVAKLGKLAPSTIVAIGNFEIIQRRSLGLICSVSCPGSIVIKTFDAIRELRDAGVVVAGGFHSPMERECLDFLLRGEQSVIVSVAKGLRRLRLPSEWRKAIEAGRLLILSPFADNVRRTTNALAQVRNDFVAALSATVLVPHASPGGKAEATAKQTIQRSQSLFTFDDPENTNLLSLGAQRYCLVDVSRECFATTQGEQNNTG